MYPGDNYVDIIGFDSYQLDEELKPLIKNGARLVCNWAKQNNKVPAMTEIGIRNGLQNSSSKDFFMDGFLNQFKNDDVGKNVAYVLTWMNTRTDSYWTPLAGQPNYNSFVNFYNDSTTYFLNDLKNIYGIRIDEPVDTTTVEVEMKEGLLKLKNMDGNWQWIKDYNTTISGMGYAKEAGNITVDTVSTDYLTVSSVYTATQNILRFGGENGLELPETAWFGTGNSNPVLRIIYKTPEKVQGIISSAVKFDGIKTDLNLSVVFNATETWDTLFISLNNILSFDSKAQNVSLDYFKILYPATVSYRLSLQIREIAFGALNLILENDKLTGLGLLANTNHKRLKIYPNPASDKVFIDLPEAKIERVYLYNNMGKCLKELNITPDKQEVIFNIEHYRAGVYYVRAESKNEQTGNRYNGVFLKN